MNKGILVTSPMDFRGLGFGVGLPKSRQVVITQVLGKSLFFWVSWAPRVRLHRDAVLGGTV